MERRAPFTFYATLAAKHLRPRVWQASEVVPSMLPASTCYQEKSQTLRLYAIPPQCDPLVADSGGFAFITKYGEYPFPPSDYVSWLESLQPLWAATMDYPCLGDTPEREIRSRQQHTLKQAEILMRERKSWEWLPVVQGRTPEQYAEHALEYQRRGLARPLMGIGSLCRRTNFHEIHTIVQAVARVLDGSEFHLFGMKLSLFTNILSLPPRVASADSGAWNGRFGRDIQAFNAFMRENGLTQTETEIQHALPTYRRKVRKALSQPKQLFLM